MSVLAALWALLFPPRCLACGKRVSPSHALCEDCDLHFERDLRAQCPSCFLEHASCRCAPACIKRAGAPMLLKLAPYTERAEHYVTRRMILNIKQNPHARAFAFLAEELAEILRPVLRERAETDGDTSVPAVLTWLPRSRRHLRAYGFDQAEGIARALGRVTGLAVRPLLKRLRDGQPQKELTAAARRTNVRGAYGISESPKGLRVILVDDLVTTGEGVAEAVRLLRRAGAVEVIPLVPAVTERRILRK